MRRYWVESTLSEGENLTIDGELFHHIFSVCRQNEGDQFELINESSRAFLVQVKSVFKKKAQVEILSKRVIPELPRPHLHLFLSLPKFSKFDEIVEKSVELGVKKITPMFSEFSHVSTAKRLGEAKHKRWVKIIKSATQQCGRGDLMELGAAINFAESLEDFNRQTNVLGLFPYEGKSLFSARQALHELESQNCQEVWLFVGSEGGFSANEVEMAQNNGLKVFSMGDQVLRVETACVGLLSILKYELNFMGQNGGN